MSIDEDEENEGTQEIIGNSKKPFFNFAESSLKRIDAILIQLGMISASLELPDLLRQKKKISLVKTFVQFAYPLAPELFPADYTNNIIGIRTFKTSSIKSGNQRVGEVYSEDLDIRLDNIIIEISRKLQQKGYFMPTINEEDEDDY